ncbi:MAG: DNA-3-methyladenine glycosylase 2 family protein [bacterium]|nr:DNA-3-methyladenine glycosylase 2 family protein [bacterium]
MDHKTIQCAKLQLSNDPILKKVIETTDTPIWTTDNNLLFDLLDAIISQQLSVKAAATILIRFQNLFNTKPCPSPEEILSKPDLELRGAGLSNAKVRYVKALSQAIVDNSLNLSTLGSFSDEEIISELTKVNGIGRWTAEMILIFSFQREDIFSLGDLGLRSAVSKWYRVEREDYKAIEQITQKWSPYRSIASRYLWQSLNNTPNTI